MYIITNHASRYYVGITKLQPLDRLKRHNNGDVYSTRWGRPWALVHSESFRNYAEARAREKQIKSWSRKRKDELIKTMNPDLKDLYGEII